MNPILPCKHFVPDAEGHQWKDGRLYIYGSYDTGGDTLYCSTRYHVFSSDDLVRWQDHGESFSSLVAQPADSDNWEFNLLYAPDCAYKDGKYYLYFCQNTSEKTEGVAMSDKPEGPFDDVSFFDVKGIDPTVLVDDDGSAYYFWGQFSLNGAKLNDDMRSLDMSTHKTDLLTEARDGFHEGSSIRKINGKYYMLFADTSRGKATCLSYAISDKPLGPYKKCGVVIDNDNSDPSVWNNHGSLCAFDGKWYVLYHRSSKNTEFNRRVCMEPIEIDENGFIREVEMTTQGVEKSPCAGNWMSAARACLLSGKVYIDHNECGAHGPGGDCGSDCGGDCGGDYDGDCGGDFCENADGHYEFLTNTHYGDFAAYKYIDFGEGGFKECEIMASAMNFPGIVEVYIDAPNEEEGGTLISTVRYDRNEQGWYDFKKYSAPVADVRGIHAVYLVFKGRFYGNQANVLSFRMV